jgi:hypothetical protein
MLANVQDNNVIVSWGRKFRIRGIDQAECTNSPKTHFVWLKNYKKGG